MASKKKQQQLRHVDLLLTGDNDHQDIDCRRPTTSSYHNERNHNNSSSNTKKRERAGNKRNQSLSHKLSWALRHGALQLGLTITSDGFVPVDEILNSTHPKLRKGGGGGGGGSKNGCAHQSRWTVEEIREVVENNDKQRFKLEERPRSAYYPNESENGTSEPTILCIRANQGHSLKGIIDPNLLLNRISSEDLAALDTPIVHGTYNEPWKSIQKQGLKRMNRTHIHFAPGIPKVHDGVISGMRKTCQIYIYIDGTKCAEDGIEFYRSDNGVLLTAGLNNEGVLPPKYFSYVTSASGNILLDNREITKS